MINTYDCKKCGAKHGMGIEDISTGKFSPINICKDCLFANTVYRPASEPIHIPAEYGGDARCMTSNGRNVNMAQELNRLEKELLKT